MNENEIRRRLEAAIDRLAAIEHDRWAHWQDYMHRAGERLPDGRVILPADQVARWDRQIATSFSDLNDAEKESDRDQVRRYLPVILAILAQR
ncbi:hypothetical protein LJR234_006378 [Mesorhizobium amorphae]|uniref:hypothetical protein n=1 Tax=Mesorhizobium amorphae TaxID=71433 RepID=UPI003ECE85D9